MGIRVMDGVKRLGAGMSVNTSIIIRPGTALQSYLQKQEVLQIIYSSQIWPRAEQRKGNLISDLPQQ